MRSYKEGLGRGDFPSRRRAFKVGLASAKGIGWGAVKLCWQEACSSAMHLTWAIIFARGASIVVHVKLLWPSAWSRWVCRRAYVASPASSVFSLTAVARSLQCSSYLFGAAMPGVDALHSESVTRLLAERDTEHRASGVWTAFRPAITFVHP